MKAAEAVERIDAAADELLRVHDAIKHSDRGVEANFPYHHFTSANEAVSRLEKAGRDAREAARLLSKLVHPLEDRGCE